MVTGFTLVLLRLLRLQDRQAHLLQQDSRAPFQEALMVMERLATEHRDSLAVSSKQMLEMVLAEAQRSQLATMTAMESLSKEWTRGLSSQQEQTTRMLGDAIALIGTKDPVAYQMVQGATRPLYESAQQPGYTTADPEGLLQTIQEQDEAQALLQKLMNGEITDVGHDGAAFGPFTPVDGAGADHGAYPL